ncbi:leucine-rich repeat containing protein, putative [Entamoeba invadens IP1]|uniref:Leucine-rich repeat containing protein, putative n=1 Tax=Entamoeba invadens IP1 TaxID=370355 RepID=L7FLV3_ENTIV|nr:leucine-rich repeat containing protein, putative [Entamoeba invadens IP1]ELP89675.1 leucine-rich repeat containing protein, putative [Entamoeba invadens IP1]|eukprot:XP_004256446.1 leucine-rich repeat containing protein, putative [Entamoeba invadens IP1]
MSQAPNTVVMKSQGLDAVPQDAFRQYRTLKMLDLSLNNIRELDLNFGKFTALTLVRFRGNLLSKVPEVLLSLQNLKTLDLSNNSISIVPSRIGEMSNLQEIILGQNKIESLPDEMSKMTSLVNMTITANRLKDLPSSLSTLTKLTFVDLCNNKFTQFPGVLGKLYSIKTLWLCYNYLSELNGIGGMRNLNQLKLLHNNFTHIPKEVLTLTQLYSIEFGDNLIQTIPTEISNLTNLKSIAFTDCLLKDIPEEITHLTNLNSLVIVRSRLTKFPKFLRKLPNLYDIMITDSMMPKAEFTVDNCELMFERNRLEALNCTANDSVASLKLKDNFLQRVPNTADLKTIAELDLTNNVIYNVEQNRLHQDLKSLNLASNRISVFPEKGINYSHLLKLNLSNNALSQLPSSLFQYIPHLQHLQLALNNLVTLPTSLTQLNGLLELNISHNKFAEFPQDILKLKKLTNLFATCNYISDLPKNLSLLENLVVLDLGCNNLISADQVVQLSNVKSLSLAFNRNLTIPSNLSLLQKLEDVSFTGTVPCVQYPLEIVSVKKMKIFEISYVNTEKRDRNRPQTIIHTPLLFLENAYCNQLKLPLSAPQFEENSCECPVEMGTTNMCGRRDSMQDTLVAITNFLGVGFHYMSIFDGHSGTDCSRFCASQFPECFASILGKNTQTSIEDGLSNTFLEINTRITNSKFKDGSAANVVLVTPQKYFVANAGDSRCLIVRRRSLVVVNEDHTISNPDELHRIREADGFIDHNKVNGEVVLTRTLGDLTCSSVCVCQPQISCVERGVDDVCVVLCCDGVFDILSNEVVGDICRRMSNEAAWVIASSIRDIAYNNGCGDNISVIVCKLMS